MTIATTPRHVITWPEQGVEMAFRLIPAGSFRMGSRGYFAAEEPIHRVTITQDFWMAETPVTQAQLAIWTATEKIDHKNHFAGRPNHPAENINWLESVAYCQWLTRTKLAEFPAGFSIACLPSEAQWEYACRAGTETEYYSGDGSGALDIAAWYGEAWDKGSTHAVGQMRPNSWGLSDMHGNVWEWCRDAWDASVYRKRPDGVCDPELIADSLDENLLRVLRGGSWRLTAYWCRSAYRYRVHAVGRNWVSGLRVCLVRSPAEKTER